MSHFEELRKTDVSEYIEKKGQYNYLSWTYAVEQLLLKDPSATWVYPEEKRYGKTLMVFCSVTAFGKTMTAQLAVMDNCHKAIENPDAVQVNRAMQRCLAKAIALHGIGLFIYAGEDLPPDAIENYCLAMRETDSFADLRRLWADAYRSKLPISAKEDIRLTYEQEKMRFNEEVKQFEAEQKLRLNA